MGTSGWSYPEWRGSFYPEGTATDRMLAHYATRLTAVEAHGTYRRLPSVRVLAGWRDQVPDHFRFAPKAYLGITHRRDLAGIEDRVSTFLAAVSALGDRLGPLLLSLPHRDPDLGRLDRLLEALPPPPVGPGVAFELGPSWYTSEVIGRIEARSATLAVVDTDDETQPLAPLSVGPFTYVRLRRSAYDAGRLDAWARSLAALRSAGRDGFVFLKHDDKGEGPRMAQHLAGLLAQ